MIKIESDRYECIRQRLSVQNHGEFDGAGDTLARIGVALVAVRERAIRPNARNRLWSIVRSVCVVKLGSEETCSIWADYGEKRQYFVLNLGGDREVYISLSNEIWSVDQGAYLLVVNGNTTTSSANEESSPLICCSAHGVEGCIIQVLRGSVAKCMRSLYKTVALWIEIDADCSPFSSSIYLSDNWI